MELLQMVANEQERTILVTLHQPSDTILGYLHEVVVLKQGKVVLDENMEVIQNALAINGNNRLGSSELIHRVVKYGKVSRSIDDCIAHCREEREASTHSLALPRECMTPLKDKRHPLAQVMALGRRLRLNYGFNYADLVALPVCFSILAFSLNFDPDAPTTIFMGCMVMFFIPIVLFQHHLHLSWDIWRTHRWELDDRRISIASFQIASVAFSLAMPLLAIAGSLAMVYSILGWDWASYPNQALFGLVFLIVIIKFGRTLILLRNGNYTTFMRIYLLCIFLFVVFGGLVSTPNQAPESLRWLFGLSFAFWAFSGILTSQFEHNGQIGEEPCMSFASCVVSDGNFLAAQSGFWPFSNTRRALNVLSSLYVVFLVSEYMLLRYCRAQFLDPSSVQKLDKRRTATRKQSQLSFPRV